MAAGRDPSPPTIILLMGVAGSGKSTIGEMLAAELNWPFRDADSFHPEANIAKMSRGQALTDADRGPWLDAIATWIDDCREANRDAIVSCSALKRAYRHRLLSGRDFVKLVFLKGDRALIAARMAARTDHFMPTALLDSQFETLEEPDGAEQPIVVPIDAAPVDVCENILARIGRR